MMILGALGLVVVVLALLLRGTTGRWSASAILVVGVLTVAAVLITANHLSPDARERRRAEDLRRDVGAALAFDIGAGSLAKGVQQEACSSDEHGWVASGYANRWARAVPFRPRHSTSWPRGSRSAWPGWASPSPVARPWIVGSRPGGWMGARAASRWPLR